MPIEFRTPGTLFAPSLASRDVDVVVNVVQGTITGTATSTGALADISNAINTTGKTLGKLVEADGRLYRAMGTTAASAWRPMDDQSGVNDITPA